MPIQAQDFLAGEAVGRLDHGHAVLGHERPDRALVGGDDRRGTQVRATRLRVIEAAKRLFIEHGYPATTIEAIAEAADVSLPTLYRLFGSERSLLAAILDTSFGGDDQPIACGNRPDVRAARAETDQAKMVNAFARIARELMARSSDIQHVLATAAQVDADVAELLAEIRRQRHTGQSRIVAALNAAGAMDPRPRRRRRRRRRRHGVRPAVT